MSTLKNKGAGSGVRETSRARARRVRRCEGDLQPKIRRAMLGKDVDMPHVSNSYFSARALVTYPERRKQLPPTDHYKQRFLDANCADLSFCPVR